MHFTNSLWNLCFADRALGESGWPHCCHNRRFSGGVLVVPNIWFP